jgi:hypothetical protein
MNNIIYQYLIISGNFTMKQAKIKVIEELFHVHKVLTISELAQHLNCAEITARRKLHPLGYFSSYTHNSRYYTINAVVKFDQHGIWCHNNICFSKLGTLKRTITSLIDNSSSGMTVSQISKIIRIKCYAPLNQLYKNGYFNRIKQNKQFIYLSKQENIYQQQLDYHKQAEHLKPQTAIQLLVEYINNPDATCQQLSQTLRQKHFQVTAEAVQSFFEKHGVKKKPKF